MPATKKETLVNAAIEMLHQRLVDLEARERARITSVEKRLEELAEVDRKIREELTAIEVTNWEAGVKADPPKRVATDPIVTLGLRLEDTLAAVDREEQELKTTAGDRGHPPQQ